MRNIVINFLSLEVMSLHPVVFWGLGIIWVLVLISALLSVRSLLIPTFAKVVWFLLIVALPILGLAMYAIRCLFTANWQMFKPLFQSRRVETQGSSAGPVVKA